MSKTDARLDRVGQDLFGPDVSYWPDFISTRAGRHAHLQRLGKHGLAIDFTLCGVRLHGAELNGRFGGEDVCRRCSAIADRHDALASDTSAVDS